MRTACPRPPTGAGTIALTLVERAASRQRSRRMDEPPALHGPTPAQRRHEPALSRSFDAIVVGSGPGGATVARELTRRGRKVLILERGDRAPVTGSMAQTLRELWMPARSLFVTNRLLAVLRGVTVGGSSVYFFGTAWEPPYELFAKHGVDLRPQVAEAKRELPIAPLPPELMGPSARRVMASAAELGYDWKPIP